jgi:hypothetical protein
VAKEKAEAERIVNERIERSDLRDLRQALAQQHELVLERVDDASTRARRRTSRNSGSALPLMPAADLRARYPREDYPRRGADGRDRALGRKLPGPLAQRCAVLDQMALRLRTAPDWVELTPAEKAQSARNLDVWFRER